VTSVVELRSGSYHDSVALMQVSAAVSATAGVQAALVAMATALNLELLTDMGFAVPEQASPDELVVAVRAADEDGVRAALAAADAALAAVGRRGTDPSGGASTTAPPRTVAAAAARTPGATLALISVPGPVAFAEAMDALQAGMSVLLFSDNVPVAQEIRLKDEAARRGLLVMGPDCGTAVVGGVGLGFANVVCPGPVGLVAASGTGAQQVLCLLDSSGVGVSHCLGVGGRDLSAAVGGRSAATALRMLDADPATELIVVVSKPAAPEVARALAELAGTLSTPVQWALLGRGRPDLSAAAERAVTAVGGTWVEPGSWPAPGAPGSGAAGGALRGLFSGGTLCDEAMVIAADTLGPIASNIALDAAWALGPSERPRSHAMLDLGDDAMTQGRAHPMIDHTLRLQRLAAEAVDPAVGVVLLDVVLGHGAHPDPAAELGPAIRAARATAADGGRELAIVVSLCGTTADPQGLDRQARTLQAAGTSVHLSNAAAARHAVALVQEGTP
jgi:FdrA protein